MPFTHDIDPVGHVHDFRHFRGNHQNSHSLCGKITHQLINLRFCADVDTLCRFIEHDDPGICSQLFAYNHLLLVPAGKSSGVRIYRRGLDGKQILHSVGQIIFLFPGEENTVGAGINHRERSVMIDRPAQMQPLLLSVFRKKTEIHIHHLARRPVVRNRLSIDVYFPGIRFGNSEDRFHDLCASRSDKTCQTDDLAGMEVEADIPEISGAGEIFHPQQFLSNDSFLFRKEITDLMTDHVADQHLLIALADVPGANIMRITKDCCPVCQAENIFKTVRDQNNGNSLVAKLSGDIVQFFAFPLRKSSSRLIHNEDAGMLRERLCNLHQLLLGNRKGTHRSGCREVCPNAV